MERFLKRHANRLLGSISGFDRVLFRGTLRSISYAQGLDYFMGSQPEQATADAGYFSEPNVTAEKLAGIDWLVAPDRQKHGETVPCAVGPPSGKSGVAEQMRQKLRTVEGRAVYRMRKAVVEPVFGQIKEQRGFRRFLLRGLGRVEAEWQLICATHNLLKLFGSGWSPQSA